MNIGKTGITLASTLGLAFILSGCVSSDDLAEALLGSVNVSGTIVDASDNDVGLQGVSIHATTDGIPGATRSYDSETVTTDGSGNYSLKVVKDLPVYMQLTKAGYATFNTVFATLTGDQTLPEIPMVTSTDAQAMIDAAFGGGINLADKAWVVVNVLAANGDDLAGATIALNNAPTASAYNNQNTCVNDYDAGTGPTVDCTATRVGPMYIAYYETAQEVSVSVAGTVTDSEAALVRMGEVTIIEFQQ